MSHLIFSVKVMCVHLIRIHALVWWTVEVEVFEVCWQWKKSSKEWDKNTGWKTEAVWKDIWWLFSHVYIHAHDARKMCDIIDSCIREDNDVYEMGILKIDCDLKY